MDYIDVGILLSQERQLSIQEAVDIINSWRANPSSYNMLLQMKNCSTPLWGYDYYSSEENKYIFKKSDKRILAPDLAYKFFELEKDDLTKVFLQTLNALTFVEEDDDSPDDNDEDAPEYDYFHWPYFRAECVAVLSADVIEYVLQDWHYVFNCEVDKFGKIYEMLYVKLLEKSRCCECLAVNSFNMIKETESAIPPEVQAKHYIMSNYSLTLNNENEDTYFRKLLVCYLQAVWVNFDDVLHDIIQAKLARNN